MNKVKKPLFSIVTVVKNDAYGLVQTIESVIEQNLSDYEYIIIGGQSEDETNSIITKYQKHIDKSIIEKDQGLYFAMNKGLDLCTGQYVNFLNSGDTYTSKDTLNTVKGELNENTEILSGSVNLVSLNGDKTYKSWKEQFHPEHFMFCFHQAMFTKRTIFEKFRFNTLFQVAADYEWALKCYLENIIFNFTEQPLVNFKEGGFSEINKIKARIEELFIQSIHFECNEDILKTNSLSKLKFYSKNNNFILPKLLANLNQQLSYFRIYEPNISMYGCGEVLDYILNNNFFKFMNIYDINHEKHNKPSSKFHVLNPNNILCNSKEYFLITALGYENEIKNFLMKKGICKDHILQFEV